MKLIAKAIILMSVVLASPLTASGQTLPAGAERQRAVSNNANITEAKRVAAQKVAAMLGDRLFVAVVERQLAGTTKPVPLEPLLSDYGALGLQQMNAAVTVRKADKAIRLHKAIAAEMNDVLELRLYRPKNFAGKVDWKNLLVAYPPSSKKKEYATVEAFDNKGASYRLDGRSPPSSPLLVVGINRKEAHRAGVAVMNRHLQIAGMQSKVPATTTQTGITTLTTNIDTTKLTRINLDDDEEPWFSGGAEIYAVVSGVQPNQAKAALSVVDLPYLEYDGTDYAPNQILIYWSQYRYAAANVQFFEHDDNTNYQELAVGLSQGVTTILGAFAPAYAVIGQVATAILQAMPSGWFSNDDDYVDTFYTLEKGRYYLSYRGAAQNATVTLVPYTLLAQ